MRYQKFSPKVYKRRQLYASLAAGILAVAVILPCCTGFRPATIPDGHVVLISHMNNVVGSHFAVYKDGSAVCRDMRGRATRFQLSAAQVRRLNAALDDPDLVPQLRVLTVRSTWQDAEEWSVVFRGEDFRINCRRVEPLPAAMELIEAAQSAARGGTSEKWFLSLRSCFP